MALQRIPTGIAGLDHALQGGYVKGRTYVLTGDAGSGKTIACLQFLLSGLRQGEKAVYVTVDEKPTEILASAASFSWDLQPYIENNSLVLLDASPYFGGHPGAAGDKGIEPQKIVADLGAYARRVSATLLIIDPVTPLILPCDAASSSQDQARWLVHLIQSQLNTTNLFTAQLPEAVGNRTGAVEQFLASGVLIFRKTMDNGDGLEHTLSIKKMRGTALERTDYRFAIVPNQGIVIGEFSNLELANPAGKAQMFEFFELPKKAPK